LTTELIRRSYQLAAMANCRVWPSCSARRPKNDDDFRKEMEKPCGNFHGSVRERNLENVFASHVLSSERVGDEADTQSLAERLERPTRNGHADNRLFYFAVADQFEMIVKISAPD